MVSKMNMPYIVADAFAELNKQKISNISIENLLTELKKEEYKNMSVKNVAKEIRRKSGPSFKQSIEELSNSHRLSPLVLISHTDDDNSYLFDRLLLPSAHQRGIQTHKMLCRLPTNHNSEDTDR